MATYRPNNHPLSLLDFELLSLDRGVKNQWSSSHFEAVMVIIEGESIITIDGKKYVLKRQNVFDEKPSAVFVSPKVTAIIEAKTPATIALCKAKAEKRYPSVFISQKKVKEEWRGKAGFRRRVINIVNTETQTQRIAVGETFNEPGEWSSFPPHKHDEYLPDTEIPLEEIYYFRIRPETGFGFQRVYTKDRRRIDKTYAVSDGDTVLIPSGYHPVVSMPGHELYYLWMLAGNERTYTWNTDPDFRWLLEPTP